MKKTAKSVSLLVSGAIAASVAAGSIAAENPFALKTLNSGYMVADAHEKMKDGKCAAGKCGAEMKKSAKKSADKAKEGACGAEKAKEGSCSAEKAKEGSCSAEKAKEGTCKH